MSGDFEHFLALSSSNRVALVASFCVNKLIDRQHQNNGSGGEGDLGTGKLEAFLVKLQEHEEYRSNDKI